MDMRTGQIYPSRDAALDAGVPEEHAVPVDVSAGIITIVSGPFKGRRYERRSDGSAGQRLKNATPSELEAERIARVSRG